MSFLARLVSGNSRSLKNFQLGALFSPATPKEQFLHGVWVFVHGHLRFKFDFLLH